MKTRIFYKIKSSTENKIGKYLRKFWVKKLEKKTFLTLGYEKTALNR
jgi:hypothetical protein